MVQVGSRTLFRTEHLVPKRIVNRPRNRYPPVYEPDTRREGGETVGEIRRAVKWIDVPYIVWVLVDSAAFLGHDRVRRKPVAQPLHDQRLSGPIGRRYQIEFALVFNRDALLVVLQQQRAHFASDIDSYG